MAMSVEEYNQRVQAWINARWPANNPCPMCHTTSGWDLAPPGEIPLRSDIEGYPSHQALPVVPVVCAHCAYVVFLSALKSGILGLPGTPGSTR